MFGTVKEFRGKYAFLSNFAPCHIEVQVTYPASNGLTLVFPFSSVESAYHAHKNPSQAWWAECAAATGREAISELKAKATALACHEHGWLREDWDVIKVPVMYQLLCSKFSDPYYEVPLLETVGMVLEEGNTWKDDFWGIDRNRRPQRGLNILGKMLMKIRTNLINTGNCAAPGDPVLSGGLYRGTHTG